jgi:hypothetical protein
MASIDDGYLVEGAGMNALADVSVAHRLTAAIEDAEAKRLGVSIIKARPRVARKLGAAPGTLENIRRFRLKNIPSWLMARIRCEFVAVLQAEIGRLEHEISIHLQTGTDPRSDDLAAAQAQVASAKKILTSAGGPR